MVQLERATYVKSDIERVKRCLRAFLENTFADDNHRDLHTGNILVTNGGHNVLLTDFGLSSTFEEAKTVSVKMYS
jgi:predicted unusual protein kinase regulating ubiquinone biosynthesis (AarF/ABC1/UbiB family)